MADLLRHRFICIAALGNVVSNVDPASLKLSPGLKRELERAGSPFPQVGVLLTAEPTIEFSTPNIALCNSLSALDDDNPITLYFRAQAADGMLGTGWISLTATRGLIVPVSISGRRGERASLSVQIHLKSTDGDTAPIANGTSSAAPTAPTGFYTLGALTLGSAISSVEEAALQFGYEVKKISGDAGKPYPTEIWADSQAAAITATTNSLAEGTEARIAAGDVETTVTLAFRLLSESAMPAASGGLLITGQKALLSLEDISGSAPAAISINAQLVASAFDGTNYLQFSTVA